MIEDFKEYHKKYYETNKERILADILAPMKCECGFTCSKTNFKRHQKSKLHLKKLSKILKEVIQNT